MNHITMRVEMIPTETPIVISFFKKIFNILVKSFHRLMEKLYHRKEVMAITNL